MDLNPQIDLFSHSYFNTTDSKGKELDIYECKAKSQEDIVLSFFQPGRRFTSEEVWKALIAGKRIHDRVPKDSIKRAISNLKRKGKLTKIKGEMTIGEYGAPLHYYSLTEFNR